MRPSYLLILLGLIILVTGISLTQIPAHKTAEEIKYRNILLTDKNSTWTFSLGRISPGSRIHVDFLVGNWLVIIYQVMRSDTKMPLREEHSGNTVMTGPNPFHTNLYDEFIVKEEAEYIITLSMPAEEKERRISFFNATILGSSAYPYQIPGAVVGAAGLVILILGIMKRRK